MCYLTSFLLVRFPEIVKSDICGSLLPVQIIESSSKKSRKHWISYFPGIGSKGSHDA